MRLAAWAERLPVPSGDGAGEPWQVVPWQRRLLSAIEDPRHQVIAVTCGRANGKTALSGLIARAYLPGGPMFAPRRQVLVVSATHQQARILVEDVSAWKPRPADLETLKEAGYPWTVANSKQTARVKAGTAEVRAVAARPKSLHGIRPDLIIADELTQWQQAPAMWAALRTSLGKRKGSKLLAVGTRPMAGSGHVFDRLLEGGADLVLKYAATEEDERAGRLGWRRTWRKANPSLDVLPTLEETIRKEWAEAKQDEQAMAQFKSLRLNMGTSEVSSLMLLDAGVWDRHLGDAPAEGAYVLGVDLGTTAAMSAVSGYWPKTGRLDALACFGDQPNLLQRGLADGVGDLYSRCWKRGELILSQGWTSDVKDVLEAAWSRWGRPSAIVCDWWRQGELKTALGSIGFPKTALIPRRMGFGDGAEDVRDFRRAFLEGKVTPTRNLLLASAVSQARVIVDPAGNEKLAKNVEGGRRKRARDDAAASSIIAVAVGHRKRDLAAQPARGLRTALAR
ncbi:MAG: hypothetical protein F4205_18130 [Gemmatimonadetes bacterium]|nr:hypothetical protein [Gemmatimonadota bacterium]MYG37393.1 hypothetical protein [Gemmatimonadota bacterium]